MNGLHVGCPMKTQVMDNEVCVAGSFAQCIVAQDSLNSGGSVMLDELTLIHNSVVVPWI